MFDGPLFRYLPMSLTSEPYHAFRIGCSAKAVNGWLPLKVFARWLCPMCVAGTWVSSWSDVIIISYHYIVICTLVTIVNWWLSSKDMKLQVLIKEAKKKKSFIDSLRIIYIYINLYVKICHSKTQRQIKSQGVSCCSRKLLLLQQ